MYIHTNTHVHTNSSLNLQFSSAKLPPKGMSVLCNENTLVPDHLVPRTKTRNCVRDFIFIYPFATIFSLDLDCRMYNVVLNKIIHKCYSHDTRITFRSRLTRFSQFLVCIQRVNNPPTSIFFLFPIFSSFSNYKDSDHECIYKSTSSLCFLSMSFYINISDLH